MRILLAEDDHNLGTWLSRALEHAGIQVEWVNDGRLADRALQQHDNYDALVLDLGLPGLDGQAVLQRLRDRDQRLPALILTARDSLDERVRSLNAGADDFLAKPFELAELEARLHALVRRARGENGISLPPEGFPHSFHTPPRTGFGTRRQFGRIALRAFRPPAAPFRDRHRSRGACGFA